MSTRPASRPAGLAAAAIATIGVLSVAVYEPAEPVGTDADSPAASAVLTTPGRAASLTGDGTTDTSAPREPATPVAAKRSKRALLCPDGTELPLLNGVPYASPINRLPRHGPLPPVVGVVTDQGGYQWYEHADGSLTTTRWVDVTVGSNVHRDVETVHQVPNDPLRYGRPVK